MKKLITLAIAILLATLAFSQATDATLSSDNTTNIATKPYSPTRAAYMFESLIDNKKGFYVDGTASGTDTYTVTVNDVITAYNSNVVFRVKFTNASTSTTPTLNVNSLGAKTIVTNAGGALTAGDLKAGGVYDLVYDGTNLRVMNVGGSGGGGWALSGTTTLTGASTIDQDGNALTFDSNVTPSGTPGFRVGNSDASANYFALAFDAAANYLQLNSNGGSYNGPYIATTRATNTAGFFFNSFSFQPFTSGANPFFTVRGGGTGTNKAFRVIDFSNTERFYIQDNGLVYVNNTFQVGTGTRYMSFSGGVSGNPFTIGNIYGTVTFGITESFSRRFYTTNGGFQGKEFHFAGSATEDTAAPSITRTSGTTGAAGLVFTADDLRIATPPANDDALTQVLVRDGSTGAIKYRTATSLGAGVGNLTTEKFTITSAQILSSNSSPITLKSAPGAESYYEVVRISVVMTDGTTVYATNTNGQFKVGAVVYLSFQLDSTADTISSASTSFSNSAIKNQAITFTTATGNPTAGNHDLIVTVSYIQVNL